MKVKIPLIKNRLISVIILSIILYGCDEEQKPSPDFIAEKTSVLTQETIQFTDLTKNGPEIWHWEFGDGFTSNFQNPTHKYKFSGKYTVKLTVTNDLGERSKIKENYITVETQKGTLLDFRDNKTYNTVKIDNQWWMSENLNYNSESSTAYKGNEENAIVYGRLYYYQDALNACPDGWHLPSKSEWEELINYAGDEPGKVLKSTDLWSYTQNDIEVTNGTGFSALPGGGFIGTYIETGKYSYFWTSSLKSNTYPINISFFYFGNSYNIGYYGDTAPNTTILKFSIRCVKD